MKQVFTLLAILLVLSAQAQFQMGFHYGLSAPKSSLGENIQPVHNMVMSGAFRLKANPQFYFGAELGCGIYAHETQEQTYISPGDGSTSRMDVDFTSNIHNYHLVAGYDLSGCTMVIPYVTMKAGASRFSTNILIEDPQDDHSCHPLVEENLFSDASFSAGGGAGVKIDFNSIFKNTRKGHWWFDFSANYLWGTSLDYVNVKYLNPDEQGPNLAGRKVGVKFVDLHTQHIHEHQVAQVFTSNINLFDFKIGVIKTFGDCR